MKTVTLYRLIQYLEDTEQELFNFDYNFASVTYNDFTIDKVYLEKLFVDYYGAMQITANDDMQFRFLLRRLWLANITNFNRLLLIQPTEFSLEKDKRTKSSKSKGTEDYSDTPNQKMPTIDSGGWLTDRTKTDLETDTENTYTINAVEQFDKLVKQSLDIVMVFMDKFNDLFITGGVVKRYSPKLYMED